MILMVNNREIEGAGTRVLTIVDGLVVFPESGENSGSPLSASSGLL